MRKFQSECKCWHEKDEQYDPESGTGFIQDQPIPFALEQTEKPVRESIKNRSDRIEHGREQVQAGKGVDPVFIKT